MIKSSEKSHNYRIITYSSQIRQKTWLGCSLIKLPKLFEMSFATSVISFSYKQFITSFERFKKKNFHVFSVFKHYLVFCINVIPVGVFGKIFALKKGTQIFVRFLVSRQNTRELFPSALFYSNFDPVLNKSVNVTFKSFVTKAFLSYEAPVFLPFLCTCYLASITNFHKTC